MDEEVVDKYIKEIKGLIDKNNIEKAWNYMTGKENLMIQGKERGGIN